MPPFALPVRRSSGADGRAGRSGRTPRPGQPRIPIHRGGSARSTPPRAEPAEPMARRLSLPGSGPKASPSARSAAPGWCRRLGGRHRFLRRRPVPRPPARRIVTRDRRPAHGSRCRDARRPALERIGRRRRRQRHLRGLLRRPSTCELVDRRGIRSTPWREWSSSTSSQDSTILHADPRRWAASRRSNTKAAIVSRHDRWPAEPNRRRA